MNVTSSAGSGRSLSRNKLIVIGLILAALLAAWFFLWDTPNVAEVQQVVRDFGWWAPVIAMVAYVAATLLLMPSSAANVIAGMAFGFGWGAVLAISASIIASIIGFASSRHFPPPVAVRKDGLIGKVKDMVEAYPKSAVFVCRAAGIFPFGISSYAFGATKVGWPSYLLGTVFGVVPGTLANVAVGAYGTQLNSWQAWGGVGASLLLMLIGGIVAPRVARRRRNLQ